MRNRKGYTLIELMVALVVLLLVTGSIYKLLVSSQRLSRAQADRVDLQSNVRTASIVIPSELRELNAVVAGTALQNDIISGTATTIRYRAMRGIGYICEAPAVGGGQLKILASTWSGLRAPMAVRDAGYVFYDNNSDLSTDDIWLPITITNVAASTCGGVAAYTLTISPVVAELGPSIPVLTPVRLFELMELSLYANAGQSWLGAQSISGLDAGPQPLLGPLVGGTGLALSYVDNSNVVTTTAVPGNVKAVRLTVVGLSSQAVSGYGGSSQTSVVRDTVTTQVTLRNAFRP